MKRFFFFLSLIAFDHLYAQTVYLDTLPNGSTIDHFIYERNGKLGFCINTCYHLSINMIKDGTKMIYNTDTCSKQKVVVSHTLGYIGINGYDAGWGVFESKTTTVKNKKKKWAVLDSNFVLVSDFIYDLAIPIVDDPVAAVKKGNLWGFVGCGGLFLEPQYVFPPTDNGDDPYENLPFDGGALWMGGETVNKNGEKIKCYIMMKNGIEVYIDKEKLVEIK